MISNRFLGSVLSFILLSGGIAALATLSSGCSIMNEKTLSQSTAQAIASRFVEKHKGKLTGIQGVTQNDSTNQAAAIIQISGFNYNTKSETGQTYDGKAVASFTKYTDGTWAMTGFILNPDELFSAISLKDLNEK